MAAIIAPDLESSAQFKDSVSQTLDSRADPDAQTIVTDFLDFTEYLPSDMVRSLTLIEELDETYTTSSLRVNELTTLWGQLPSIPSNDRPGPLKVRHDISQHLNRAVNSRVFAHAEAVRMSANVNRHYSKAKLLLEKLQAMMDSYPSDDGKGAALPRSPQLTRHNKTSGRRNQKRRVPQIIVPGEVLAPYDMDLGSLSDDSGKSSEDELASESTVRRASTTAPRIKLVTNKTPKPTSRPVRPLPPSEDVLNAAILANAAALLRPPPVGATAGSLDAPWLQLTDYELAKLRKRMKKNAAWTPSETMISRELEALERGLDAYYAAKKKAEGEGRSFEAELPISFMDESGEWQLPPGAISLDTVVVDETSAKNKNSKREGLAKMAATEAEASARQMAQTAKTFLGASGSQSGTRADATRAVRQTTGRPNSRANKRKRNSDDEATTDDQDVASTAVAAKRAKRETPVLPPIHPSQNNGVPTARETLFPPSLLTPTGSNVPITETPVPIPVPRRGSSMRSGTSPTPSAASMTKTTAVSLKPPAETPVPLPVPRVDVVARFEAVKRETRGDAAKRGQTPYLSVPSQELAQADTELDQKRIRDAASRATPALENARRPGSRGRGGSQELQPGLASDRPRRASTARNTPAPEARPPSKRAKRPAPGVVSTTNSGGNSAVGKRKAAPKRKARATRKGKGQVAETEAEMEADMEEVEVDDNGDPIDPDEPRYCVCNRVSFGSMIQCENVNVREAACPYLPFSPFLKDIFC